MRDLVGPTTNFLILEEGKAGGSSVRSICLFILDLGLDTAREIMPDKRKIAIYSSV